MCIRCDDFILFLLNYEKALVSPVSIKRDVETYISLLLVDSCLSFSGAYIDLQRSSCGLMITVC